MSWWVAYAQRTLTEEVAAAPEKVRLFYTDLDNMKLVHPLVVAVHPTKRNQTPDSYTQEYRIRDRIPFGPFVIPATYRALLKVPAAGDVTFQARQCPRVRLDGTVTFEPISDGRTRVIERLRIHAPRPLARFTVREAVSAHITVLRGIRNHFQPPAHD